MPKGSTKTISTPKKQGALKLTINGESVSVNEGATILDAAKKADVYIPTLCHHDSIKPFGACRLCIVEVKDAKGLVTACTAPAVNGMEVKTETEKLRNLRKNILELILTEHPSTCLVCAESLKCRGAQDCARKVGMTTSCHFCPNNAQCDLQMVWDHIKLTEMSLPIIYKSVPLERDDPFFDRDYNLCVLCDRCVRACKWGVIEMMQRGSDMAVGTAMNKTHTQSNCQFCGACVDICPTGTLVERRRRWEGRADKKLATTCPYCSVGCSLTASLKQGKVIETIPDGEGCVRGRFCATDLNSNTKRILKPMIRQAGKLVEVPWAKAIETAAKAIEKHKGSDSALVYSASLFNETMLLAHKFAKDVMKTSNIMCPLSESEEPFWKKANEEGVKKFKRAARVSKDSKDMGLAYFIGEDVPDGANADFVIIQDMFLTPAAERSADVVFPAASFFESAGTTINNDGLIRKFSCLTELTPNVKEDWRVISELAAKLEAKGFSYRSSEDILKELGKGTFSANNGTSKPASTKGKILELGPRLCDFAYRSVKLSDEIKGIQRICQERWPGK
ncbi:molybdopterin-dependent oxidoreductase [Elusimicrobiota bacterium]